MDVADMRLCLLLHNVPSLSDTRLANLLLHTGSPREALAAGARHWRSLGLPEVAISGLRKARLSAEASSGIGAEIESQLRHLQRSAACILPLTDAAYPPLLKTIPDPPPLLYVRGNPAALLRPQLAVVGSRKASSAGIRAARLLSAQACEAGLALCSGLALGIDAAAHRGAMAAGGCGIGVMATGIDRIYPSRHAELAAQLLETGCLVSEFPPGVRPLRHNFPRRNRVISGLSLGTLVVEAALPSGSLITAGTALEQGREVFTLPWSIFHPNGTGCLQLLADGATMVLKIEDIVEQLGSLYTLQRELNIGQAERLASAEGKPEVGSLAPEAASILQLLGCDTQTTEQLLQDSAIPASRLLAALSTLELEGLVARSAEGYVRC